MRPVPAVRPLLSMRPHPLCKPLLESGTGDRNLYKSPLLRCRSAGESGSNLVRATPTGRGGQGKFGLAYFGEGLGHFRIIHLFSLHFMTSLASNHSIICTPRIRWLVVYKRGVYTWF